MTVCKNCGEEAPETANFCPNCGYSLSMKKEEFEVDADKLVEKVKEIIREGNVNKIIVKNEEDKTLLNIPVTVGVVGTLIAPWLAALGAIAAIATKCTIIVEREK